MFGVLHLLPILGEPAELVVASGHPGAIVEDFGDGEGFPVPVFGTAPPPLTVGDQAELMVATCHPKAVTEVFLDGERLPAPALGVLQPSLPFGRQTELVVNSSDVALHRGAVRLLPQDVQNLLVSSLGLVKIACFDVAVGLARDQKTPETARRGGQVKRSAVSGFQNVAGPFDPTTGFVSEPTQVPIVIEGTGEARSEEHTSELQSRFDL